MFSIVTGSPMTVLSLPIANDPILVGFLLNLQGAVVSPGANQLGVITSNGIQLKLGEF